MNGHECIIETLISQDIDTNFTLMSEGIMELLSKVESEHSEQIQLVKSRHEQGAMAMADGYSRAGNDIGVCLVGRGPAIAQTGTAMVTARKRGSNLLIIVPSPSLSTTYDIKEFEQRTYLRSTVAAVHSIRSEETFVSEFQRAVRQVKAGDGPLAVQIPRDVLDAEISSSPDREYNGKPSRIEDIRGRVRPNEQRVRAAIDMYVEADGTTPPVILAGRGAMQSNAKDELEAFADRTGAALVTTLQSRNYVSEHPNYLGFVGGWGTERANQALSEASIVFVVGASLNPFTTDQGALFDERTQIVHIDEDPSNIGRYMELTLAIHGDARETVGTLIEELEGRRKGESSDRKPPAMQESPDSDSPRCPEVPDVPGKIDPRELVNFLDETLPENRRVVLDIGQFAYWIYERMEVSPTDMTFTGDFASVGLGLPMGIGVSVASEN